MKKSLFACVSAALWLSASVLQAQHSAVEAVPRPDDWWKKRQESMNQRVQELGSRAQVIFIGDSITQGWEGEGKEVWARYYASRNAINLGIGGDRTQHVLWRLENGNLTGLKPKAAVVMIGTNNSNGEDNTPGQIVEGVRLIVEKLRTTLPDTKIVLLAIFPRGENYNPQRGKLAQINQVLHKLADERNVFWMDLAPQFLNPDGTLPRALMPDYLHLSPRAYGLWAEGIEDLLSRLVGDTRVTAATGTAPDLSGEWLWTIAGPDDQPVTAPMNLKAVNGRITGTFVREGRSPLVIDDGKQNGNEFTWTVKRERPDGSQMTYEMSGRLVDGKIEGMTKTKLDGADFTRPWSARRK